jgi:predicted nucleotidyltransferase
MRIDEQQHFRVCQTLRRYFGSGAQVWLFGSRADDAHRGGDVDLYVEAELDPAMNRVMKKLEAGAALEDIFDGARVDLVVRFPREVEQPIHRIAKTRGVRL